MQTLHRPAGPAGEAPGYRWERLGSRPRRGWELVDVEDLEEPGHVCEACGYPEVRYVHHLRHSDSGDLSVGCVCAEHLTGDYVGHRQAERIVRNRQARLAWLLDLGGWKPTRRGNLKIKYAGWRLVLHPSRFGAGWRINVGDILGRRDHPTQSAAIRTAFRYIDPAEVKVDPSL